MAIHVNKAMIVGRLGADPEAKGAHGDMVTMRVATSESWVDKQSGERKERTQWHSVVIFNEPTARFVLQYAKKGDLVFVEGQIETRVWERNPDDRVYYTEIVVRPFNGGVQLQSQERGDQQVRPAERREPAKPQPKAKPQGRNLDLDDEIPFMYEWR